MQITLEIPDKVAAYLVRGMGDAAQSLLEDAAVEAYREERISEHELQLVLGLETRYELDGVLKARGVWLEYTDAELQKERLVMQEILRRGNQV